MRSPRDGRDGLQGERGLPGLAGKDGATGARGLAGASAYAIAVSKGFQGDEDAFLASLKGERGVDGSNGVDGQDGAPGRDGAKGLDGLPGESGRTGKAGETGARGPIGPEGPPGPIPAHEWIGTSLRFELPSGQWGPTVDLKGDPGKNGRDGIGGGAVVGSDFVTSASISSIVTLSQSAYDALDPPDPNILYVVV